MVIGIPVRHKIIILYTQWFVDSDLFKSVYASTYIDVFKSIYTSTYIDGGLITLCHSCEFACHQRVLKTFPGPDYILSEDGVVWQWHFLVKTKHYIFLKSYIPLSSKPSMTQSWSHWRFGRNRNIILWENLYLVNNNFTFLCGIQSW